jgi:protein TonB
LVTNPLQPICKKHLLRPVHLVFGVVCAHLALLWWAQVGQQNTMPQVLPIHVQLSPDASLTVEPAARPRTPVHPAKKEQPIRPIAKSQPLASLLTPVPAPTNAAPAYNTPGPDTKPADLTGANVATAAANVPKTDTTQVNTSPATKPDAVQLPSSSAEYLNNPLPAYARTISQRLGEQGKVVIRVLISKDGSALQGEVFQSSGFERLDQMALRTVLAWRYVPGQRNGQAQDMWFNVPINFKLN